MSASFMYSSSAKRYRSPSPSATAAAVDNSSRRHFALPPHLYLQAHEAELIRGHDDLAADTEGRGSRCLQWTGQQVDGESVWIDRYDVLNLLGSLPMHLPRSPTAEEPPSPTMSIGFSDLPSDSEEMFFFTATERDDVTRQKKRRKLEEGRRERIRALEAEEQAAAPLEETQPSDTQLALMNKLSATLQAAQDPALLEMRILANHGSDPRFSFLRKGGKWREEWETIRKGGKSGGVESTKPNPNATIGAALVGASYNSDDEDQGDTDVLEREQEEGTARPSTGAEASADLNVSAERDETSAETEAERAKRAAKAEKVKEWARKRKETRDAAEAAGRPS